MLHNHHFESIQGIASHVQPVQNSFLVSDGDYLHRVYECLFRLSEKSISLRLRSQAHIADNDHIIVTGWYNNNGIFEAYGYRNITTGVSDIMILVPIAEQSYKNMIGFGFGIFILAAFCIALLFGTHNWGIYIIGIMGLIGLIIIAKGTLALKKFKYQKNEWYETLYKTLNS